MKVCTLKDLTYVYVLNYDVDHMDAWQLSSHTLRLELEKLSLSLQCTTAHAVSIYHLQRGSAQQSVKDGLGPLWQHGHFNTSQLRNLSSDNDETSHVS